MMSKILDFLNDLRPRQIFLLAGVATIIMFAAIYIIFSKMSPSVEENSAESTKQEYVDTRNVVVLKSDVAARTILTEDMLQMKKFPVDLIPSGAIMTIHSVVGQSAGVTMSAGEILTGQKLRKENLPSNFVESIPKDCRAVSVGIGNITGVGGFAKAGDYVDVILVQKNEQSANSKLILQNILLLSINKNTAEEISKNQTTVSNPQNELEGVTQNSEQEEPTIATLALTPQQAMELVSAAALGEIYLTLRPSNPSEGFVDDTDFTMRGLTKPSEPSVTASVPAANPVAAKVPPAPVAPAIPSPAIPAADSSSFEVIQGDKILGK